MNRYCLEYSTRFGECAAEIFEDDNGDYVRFEDADYWRKRCEAAEAVINKVPHLSIVNYAGDLYWTWDKLREGNELFYKKVKNRLIKNRV